MFKEGARDAGKETIVPLLQYLGEFFGVKSRLNGKVDCKPRGLRPLGNQTTTWVRSITRFICWSSNSSEMGAILCSTHSVEPLVWIAANVSVMALTAARMAWLA